MQSLLTDTTDTVVFHSASPYTSKLRLC